MNNLLLLAVVAVLYPIPSFTESNLIDGRRECCGHRSNSPDIRLYGNRKSNSEDRRRLESRSGVKEVNRDETITRSRDRVTIEGAERRVSELSTRPSVETQLSRDQEPKSRILQFQARENRRTYDSSSRATRQNEPDVDSWLVRTSRDDTKLERMASARQYRDTLDSRRVRTAEEMRRVATNTETMTLLRREREGVGRDATRHDSRLNAFRSLQVDNNRARRTLDGRRKNNENDTRLSRSLDSRVKSDNRREKRFRSESREERERNVRGFSEKRDERRQGVQNRESNDRTNAIRRTLSQKMLTDLRFESRNTREGLVRREVKGDYSNERVEEQRHQRDGNRLSQVRSTLLGASIADFSAERSLPSMNTARQSQLLGTSTRFARSQNTRLARSAEQRDERRSAEVSLSRKSRDVRAIERDSINDRNSAQILDRNVRERGHRADIRTAENLEEPRTINSMLRESRDYEQRQEIRYPSRSEVPLTRESRTRGDMRDNERIAVSRRQLEEQRVLKKHKLTRMSRDNARRQDREFAEISLNARRPSSLERVTRKREVIRSLERTDVRRDNRDVRDARDRSGEATRLTRIHRSLTDEDMRDDIRREFRRERDEIRVNLLSREINEEQRREIRKNERDSRTVIRNEITRNLRELLRERSELRQQTKNRAPRTLQRQSRDIITASSIERRLPVVRDREMKIQNERMSDSRDNVSTEERSARNNNRYLETTMTRQGEREVHGFRFSSTLDREINSGRRNLRAQANLRSIDTDMRAVNKDQRFDNRILKRDSTESRSHFYSADQRGIYPGEETPNKQNPMNWQMIFYTLQGVYLCSLLMKMLTEKSDIGKTRNFTWFLPSTDLVKVD